MGRLNRHTMGNDWGGRGRANPPNAEKVSATDVRAYAAEHGFKVRREGPGWSMWFGCPVESNAWRTLGTTNYLALQELRRKTAVTEGAA